MSETEVLESPEETVDVDRSDSLNKVQVDGTLETRAGADGQIGYHSWKPGTNLEEAVELYGADLVFDFFVKQGTRNLQNSIRGHLTGGGDVDGLAEALSDWRPDTTRRRQADPFAKIVKAVESMDEAEQLAYIQKLQDRLASVIGGE